MVAEWYYRTPTGRTEGPVTAAHLKQLADLGEIVPETEIRKGAEGRWVTANKVKGLIAPVPQKPVKTAPPSWQQPRNEDREPESVPHDPLPPLDRPLNSKTETAKKRSSLLLVGTYVGGILLIVGLIAVASSMFGKKDEPLQQVAKHTPNENDLVPKQPQPEPAKPRDEGKEAADAFDEFARERVKIFNDAVVGQEQTKQIGGKLSSGLDGTSEFTWKIAAVKLRDTDVRRSDSVSAPFVGTIEVEVEWQLVTVKGFPKEFVPASAKAPTRRASIECVRTNGAWKLKSIDDVVVALTKLPQ